MSEEKKTVLEIPIPSDGRSKDQENDKSSGESIEERAKREATRAGQQMLKWDASYTALVRSISGFYANKINEKVHPINDHLGKFLNGLRWDLNNGPDSIMQKAAYEYASLRGKAAQYQGDYKKFNEKLKKEQQIFPDLSEDDIRKTKVKTTGGWILFFAILGVVVLFESAANMSLLASALAGGLIEAFMVATLVSVINVMGVGTGVGFLCAFLFRKMRSVFYIVLPLWFSIVILLNLVVGRYREEEILGIEYKEKTETADFSSEGGLTALEIIPSEIAEVSFNVISWHFESVLFFLLGIALSCFGFYKGFFFFKPGENLKPRLDKLDETQEKINEDLSGLPERYNKNLTELREKVTSEIRQIDKTVRDSENAFEDMEISWKGIITVIEAEFINSYNRAHPEEKITQVEIQKYSDTADFPATRADRDAIGRGKTAIKEYEDGEQELFYTALKEINDQISRVKQEEYQQSIRSLMDDVAI